MLPSIIEPAQRHHELTLKQIVALGRVDPLGLWDQYGAGTRVIREGIRRFNWHAVIAGYAGAEFYRDHPDGFVEVQERLKQSGRQYDANLKHVLLIGVCSSTDAGFSGRRYKTAAAQAQNLQPYFDRRVSPEEVFGLIEAAGGFKGLKAETRARTIEPARDRPKVRLLMPCERPALDPQARGPVRINIPDLREPQASPLRPEPGHGRPRLAPIAPPNRQGGHPQVKRLRVTLDVQNEAEFGRIRASEVGEWFVMAVECRQSPDGRKYLKAHSVDHQTM